MNTELTKRLEVAVIEASKLNHWATHYVVSCLDQVKKGKALSETQMELIVKAESEFGDSIIWRRDEWNNEKADNYKKCVDYYAKGPYYTNIVRKSKTDPNYIPTRGEYEKLAENKYSKKYLHNLTVPAKFEVGDLVQIRKNRGWDENKFAIITQDNGVQSHVEGSREYVVNFFGGTETAKFEERDLKVLRKSAVDKLKAQENNTNV